MITFSATRQGKKNNNPLIKSNKKSAQDLFLIWGTLLEIQIYSHSVNDGCLLVRMLCLSATDMAAYMYNKVSREGHSSFFSS